MDNELDTLTATQTDFQESSSPIWTNQHREVIELKCTNRVLIRVENVLIDNAMLSGAIEDDRIHVIKLS